LNSTQFDRFAQGLAVRFSRRGALGALTGSALGAALGLGAIRDADAAPKPADAKCSTGSQCASGTCIKYGKCKKKSGKLTGNCRCSCSETVLCPTGKSCRNEACFADCPTPSVCPEGDLVVCDQEKGCQCWETDLGPSCTSRDAYCSSRGCTTSVDCPTGQVCQSNDPTCFEGCAPNYCINPCGLGRNDPTTSTVSTSGASSAEHAAKRQGNRVRVDLTEYGK